MNQESTVGLADALGVDQDFDAIATKARETIEAFVQERPHAALGIAAAAGFVVGGGLTPRRLFKLLMSAGGPLLSRQLSGQVARAVAAAMADNDGGPDAEGSPGGEGADNDAKPKRPRRARTAPET